MSLLHVTNGESAARRIRAAGLGGEVLPWDDVLHEGPLVAAPPATLRRLRADFLAAHGWGEADALADRFARRDARLAHAVAEAQPIVLWFEHDLFDQLQLVQVLAVVGDAPAELVQSTAFLGEPATQLRPLWARRTPVTRAQRALARAAWEAVCARDLGPLLAADTSALPCLHGALERLREEWAPHSRTERQLLAALAAGPRDPVALFAANQAAEEAPFLGDTWCYLRLYELARAGLIAPVEGPMPLPPPRGDHDRFTRLRLALAA